MNHPVPVIDLSGALAGERAARLAVARAIESALVDVGFFSIVGHGVPESLIAETRAEAVEFFALPDAEKRAVSRPPDRVARGYSWVGDRALAYSYGEVTPPDLHESFVIGPEPLPDLPYYRDRRARGFYAPNIWPTRPARLRPCMLSYFQRMDSLATEMMRLFALALGIEERFFDTLIDRPTPNLRLIRYPGRVQAPEPGQLRAGAHTDYGTITILRGDNRSGGLQVRHRNGDWIEVTRPEDGFVCNIGDVMMRWTNDHWVSNLHRVALPPDDAAEDRISLVFFHNPNYDAEIRCIETCRGDGEAKYPPVPFDGYYLDKLMRTAHKTDRPPMPGER
ncbi:MAG: isopenicillin N synthase family oxygenase [Alphaproteobacteria bacterium]|nr:isopenicillin N synthase family oxygenase [Alphaproteobacteria bacterium]